MKVRKGFASRDRFTSPEDWRRIEVVGNVEARLDAAYVITTGIENVSVSRLARIADEVKNLFVLTTKSGDLSIEGFDLPITIMPISDNWTIHTPNLNPPYMEPRFFRERFDIPYKRNFALAHARSKGFRYILLVDDDIVVRRGIGCRASGVLRAGYAGYGTYSLYHPDKSVVDLWMHLENGQSPEVSISGNCLALDVDQNLAFFPLLYNEDWIFFQSCVERRNLRLFGGESVVQMPARKKDQSVIAFQQFGEIVVKCIFDEPKRSVVTLENLLCADRAHAAIEFHARQLHILGGDWHGREAAITATEACCADGITRYGEALLRALSIDD